MSNRWEYLVILLAVFGLTVWIERHYRLRLFSSRKQRWLITAIFFIVGSAWDSYATMRGMWQFPSGNNLGLTLGVLPLEEYVFMLVQPYFIVTVFTLLNPGPRQVRP